MCIHILVERQAVSAVPHAACVSSQMDFYTCTYTGGKKHTHARTQHTMYRYTQKDKNRVVLRVVLSLLPIGTQLCNRREIVGSESIVF